MPEPTLVEIGQSVTDLRAEIEKKSTTDRDKIVRINAFLDGVEENVNQPIVRAQEEAKNAKLEIESLSERLEKSGASRDEIKARVDTLEIELARRDSGGPAADDGFKDTPEYKALNDFCRLGFDRLEVEQKQLLRTDSAPEGGFLVATEMDNQITKKITEIDPIRSIARVRTTGSKSIELPIRNTIPLATYEGETETGNDSVSTYQAETVTPFRQTATSPITLDMLQDASFDMDAEIASDAAEAFAFGEGEGFVIGTGFKQPAGFATDATLQAAARVSGAGAGGNINAEDLILLTGDLKQGYDPVYVLNRRTLATIRTFRADAVAAGDSASAFLWAPGLNGPTAATINGFPYVLANSMPDIGIDLFCVAFGDFRRGYVIVDRTGMSVIRDEFTLKKQGIVEFTMNRWNTGRIVLQEPLKLLQATS